MAMMTLVACAPRHDFPIDDLAQMPQDAGAYHHLQDDTALIPPDRQAALYADFLRRFFAPWHRDKALIAKKDAYWPLPHFQKSPIYGENTRQRNPQWFERMRRLARPDEYPSMAQPGVTLETTSMRGLPTVEPAFHDFDEAGEGYPFDYNQTTRIPAGTPILITHESADGRYVLAESRISFGWIPARDVAAVDAPFMNAYEAESMAAFVKDRIALRDMLGQYRLTADIGTVLPMYGHPGEYPLTVLVPVGMPDGYAALIPARVPEKAAVNQPLAPTPKNFAKVANGMLGRPYGWGGMYEDRDCSALTMDLMTPFGIYLPRNSGQQARFGQFTAMDAMDAQSKKLFIANAGVPFLTLVRSPGHIMLYVGNWHGEPAIMHAMWGVKMHGSGRQGRVVVGEAVITTLDPGGELPGIKTRLIDAITGMSRIATKKATQ